MKKTLAVVVLVCSLPAFSVASDRHREDGASIAVFGSSSTQGFKLDIWSTGRAHIAIARASRWGHIDPKLSRKLFRDLRAARNAHARSRPCTTRASFGRRRIALWHGWTSPDLRCSLPGVAAAVREDVDAILSQLNVGQPLGRTIRLPRNEPRAAPVTPMPPQRRHRASLC